MQQPPVQIVPNVLVQRLSHPNESELHVMECDRYRPLCPVWSLCGTLASHHFQTGIETGTMACTKHTP
jgi:hypothetical protein